MSTMRQADWLTFADALDVVIRGVQPLDAETVPLEDALGRTLAESVVSPIDQPPWDNSAMDGFAVRAADVIGASREQPRRLRVIEAVPAGRFPTRRVGPGEAIRLMTGAPIPEGADSVIRIEHAHASEDFVEILDDADAQRNIRARGEDVKRGSVVLSAGARLRAGEIGVLAAVGRPVISVYRRARVGILSTGNELATLDEFDEVLAGRRLIDSNSYSLAAAVQMADGVPVRLGLARDDARSIDEHLAPAFELDALITTAGASVGDHDFVKDALERAGMQTQFWRVKIRPGSPFAFGRILRESARPLPVFVLPGNPVSALVTFEVLVKPALRKMHGRDTLYARTIPVRLGERVRSPAGLLRFLRVTMEHSGRDVQVRLTGSQSSGVLSSVARADALLVVPMDVEELQPGAPGVAIPLGSNDDAQATPGF